MGDPAAEDAGDRGPGELRPGDFSPESLVLCCRISSLPGLPGDWRWGEGGAEPLVIPGVSMPSMARCIWQLRHSHSLPYTRKQKGLATSGWRCITKL